MCGCAPESWEFIQDWKQLCSLRKPCRSPVAKKHTIYIQYKNGYMTPLFKLFKVLAGSCKNESNQVRT